jgi:hypothetical protein
VCIFFTLPAGVNLMWDPTLLRGSTPQELDALVNALHGARSRFHNAPPHLFRAFVRSSDRMAAPQLSQQFRAWADATLVLDLPQLYESTKKDDALPLVIRDAVKVGAGRVCVHLFSCWGLAVAVGVCFW